MGYRENYIAFGFVNALTGFWYAAAILFIVQNDVFGWVLAVLSIPLIWGMKRYTRWLFRGSDRRRLTRLFIAHQASATLVFLLVLILKRYE